MGMIENDFKRWCREKWREERGGGRGWVGAHEYARGGDSGTPDTSFLNGFDLVPVELKTATIANGQLHLDDVRPAQIQWHFLFNRAGGTSAFLVGVISADGKSWDPFIVHPSFIDSKNPKLNNTDTGPAIALPNDDGFSASLSNHLHEFRRLTLKRMFNS